MTGPAGPPSDPKPGDGTSGPGRSRYATAVLPRLDHPKPTLPPGAPHPDAPPPGRPKVPYVLLGIGAFLFVPAALFVAPVVLRGGW